MGLDGLAQVEPQEDDDLVERVGRPVRVVFAEQALKPALDIEFVVAQRGEQARFFGAGAIGREQDLPPLDQGLEGFGRQGRPIR